jgi:Flp pilus assembly pilin Flp
VYKHDLSRRAFLFGQQGRGESFRHDERVATAIEYGLILSLMVMGLVPVLTQNGRRQEQNYRCIKRAMRGVGQTRFCKKKGA